MELLDELDPTKRIAGAGPAALSEIELLATILKTGGPGESSLQLAERLMVKYKSLKEIKNASVHELCLIRNIDADKAARIKASFELGNRVFKELEKRRPKIQNTNQAVNILMPRMCCLEREEMIVICLDSGSYLQDIVTVYRGSANRIQMRPAEIFKPAIRLNSVCIIMAHNHPSGNPEPSPEDIRTTAILRDAGTLLGVRLLDHIIIGGLQWRSMKEMKLGF